MPLEFNVAPYFDDYEATKNFYKVLFQPSRPVQTRELNQLQTILQEQVSRFGNHMFKNGTMVIPGHVFYNGKVKYVKLAETNSNGVSANAFLTDDIIGKTVTSGGMVVATIITYAQATDTDPAVLIVSFKDGGDDGELTFVAGDDLVLDDTIVAFQVASTFGNDEVGPAAIASIGDGIYYVNGYFVNVEAQNVIISKFNNTPTTRVGLNVVETIVTENDDVTLFDNALGYPNYGAPGASRYKIELVLETRTIGTSDYETANIEKFIDLIELKAGEIVYQINYTQYSEIMKMLAQRTYDESGDYEIEPFTVKAKDYRSNNRGDWTANTAYLVGDIVTVDGYYLQALSNGISGNTSFGFIDLEANYQYINDGVIWGLIRNPAFNSGTYNTLSAFLTTETDLASKFVYEVSRGSGYVKGFPVQKYSPSQVVVNKATEFQTTASESLINEAGSFVELTNLQGVPEVGACEEVDIHFFSLEDQADFASVKVQATATLTTGSGAITKVTITNPGFGYDKNNPPMITAGTPGSGAVLRAVIDESTRIKEIKVVSGGTSFTGGSSISIAAPIAPPIIGSCRIRSVTYKNDNPRGVFGTSAASYRTEVFDVKLNEGFKWERHARSFRLLDEFSDTVFSADIANTEVELPGTVVIVEGQKDITGVGTNFLDALAVGQSVIIRRGADSTEDLHGVVAINETSNVSCSVVKAWVLPGVLENVNYTGCKLIAVYNNFVSSGISVQPMPKEYIRHIRAAGDVLSTMHYDVKRKIATTTSDAGTTWSTTLAVPGETFAPLVDVNYIVSVKKTADPEWTILNPNAGTPEYTLALTGANKILTVSDLLDTYNYCNILCTISKTGTIAREKVKVPEYVTLDITSKLELDKLQYSLGKADVYQLVQVWKSVGAGELTGDDYPAFVQTDAEDITDKFIFDSGQNEFYYGLSSVKYTGKIAPDNTIRIVFAYFKHSSGDYFSVDSYPSLPYNGLPPIIRDGLDFRPTVGSDGSFSKAMGADITEPIPFGGLLSFDYSAYLPRRDIVYLTHANSEFKCGSGTASFSLPAVNEPADAMTVAEAVVLPGLVYPELHQIKKVPHVRYTMEDIGRLARRVENIEYYVQLSLLEQETINRNIVDENGLDRFKLGVMVDQFKDYESADTNDPEYIATIDPAQKELRPMFLSEHMPMKELLTTDTQRLSQNYRMDGNGRITINYTSATFISQPGATRTEYVNPYAVISYEGRMKLFPSSDNWTETTWHTLNPITDYSKYVGPTGMVISQTWNQWTATWDATGTGQWGSTYGAKKSGTFSAANAQKIVTAYSPTQSNGSNWNAIYNTLGGYSWWDSLINGQGSGAWNIVVKAERTGTKTYVKENRTTVDYVWEYESIYPIPYIRARPISVSALGLAPNTNVDVYIDKVLANSYMTSNSLVIDIGFTNATIYTKEDNWEDSGWNEERQDAINWQRFDEYTGSLIRSYEGNYAVVVRKVEISTGWRLYCVRRSTAAFSAGTGGGCAIINDATITAVVISRVQSLGLKTDSLGNFIGKMYFPSNSQDRFAAGFVDIRVCKRGDEYATSEVKANAQYYAVGMMQDATEQQVTHVESIVASDPTSQTISVSGSHDPLAQTFYVDKAYKHGVFVPSVKIWIAEKDFVENLRVEIRPVVNGYPDATKILAFKELAPSRVVAVTPFSSSGFTQVVFDSLVYLEPDKEYALVLLANSKLYKAWISRMGEVLIGQDRVLTDQPTPTTIGSLFKSQNGKTWEPSQYEDLTFEVLKAVFNTSGAAIVPFVNSNPVQHSLGFNAMTAINGNSTVQVTYANHGFVVGDLVVINYDLGTSHLFGADASMEGVIEGTYEVTAADLDHFEFTMKISDGAGAVQVATDAGAAAGTHIGFGGTNITAHKQHIFTTIMPSIDITTFDNTDYTLAIRTMTTGRVFSDEFVVMNKENVHFDTPQQIVNADQLDGGNAFGKSFFMTLTMSTNNADVSPVFARDRTALALVRNVINDPVLDLVTPFHTLEIAEMEANFDYNSTNPELSYFEAVEAVQADAVAVWSAFDAIMVGMLIMVHTADANDGKVFTVTGKSKTDTLYRIYVKVDPAYNTGSESFTDIEAAAASWTLSTGYVEEFAPARTSVIATHLTKPMQLKDSATSLQVLVDMNVPTGTWVDVYYRASPTNNFAMFSDTTWTKMDATPELVPVQNFTQFVEERYMADNMPEFDQVQVKIVMRSPNEALVPRIKNLRIMAFA